MTGTGALVRLIQIFLLGMSIAAASPATASPPDVTTATIEDLSRAMAKREVTSEQLVRAYLARIEAFDDRGPAINAVIALNPAALVTARALDRERRAKGPRGLLHGIPVLVKDNIDVAGLPTTVGSQLLEGNVAAQDAWVVRRLRDAGAVIVAKVNLSEFAALGGSVLGAPDHLVKLGTCLTASAPPAARRAIPTTRSVVHITRAAAPARPSRRRSRRSASEPTPAARSAARRPGTESSA